MAENDYLDSIYRIVRETAEESKKQGSIFFLYDMVSLFRRYLTVCKRYTDSNNRRFRIDCLLLQIDRTVIETEDYIRGANYETEIKKSN